jgi:hypothetical protein
LLSCLTGDFAWAVEVDVGRAEILERIIWVGIGRYGEWKRLRIEARELHMKLNELRDMAAGKFFYRCEAFSCIR